MERGLYIDVFLFHNDHDVSLSYHAVLNLTLASGMRDVLALPLSLTVLPLVDFRKTYKDTFFNGLNFVVRSCNSYDRTGRITVGSNSTRVFLRKKTEVRHKVCSSYSFVWRIHMLSTVVSRS